MNPSPLHIVILAAGQGKRMRSRLPKVLQKLAGRPLLQHVLSLAAHLSADRVTVVHGHGGDAVRAAFAVPDLEWAEQSPPRGTGDAVRCALELTAPAATPEAGVVLVLYGDVPLLQAATVQRLVDAARQGQLALLTQQREDPTGYGRVLRDADQGVCAIVEQKDATPEQRTIREVNTGILAAPAGLLRDWVARLDCNNVQQEYYLTDVVGFAAGDHVPIVASQPTESWEADGVNDPLQLATLERQYQRWLAEGHLVAGVRLADPSRFDQRGQLLAGQDVEIDVSCIFEGQVTLGDGVVVEAHCVLRNCSIGPGSRIKAFSHLDQARVGADCQIGPYARLRPGTELADGAHIGNFVELKNARFGAGSKANHLSYVGDAVVGSDVNIGAGVITCNYDGANKHQTVIGDGAFIGSDAQLVAPVTVGAGATIGAGTTLVSDAPPDQLTLSRTPQRSIARWQRPKKTPR